MTCNEAQVVTFCNGMGGIQEFGDVVLDTTNCALKGITGTPRVGKCVYVPSV